MTLRLARCGAYGAGCTLGLGQLTKPEDVVRSASVVDPECATITNTKIGQGLLCAVKGERTYYMPTEKYTGEVPTWGEFRGWLDFRREDYGASGTQSYVSGNPSWVAYLGNRLWTVQQGDYSVVDVPDSFRPPVYVPNFTPVEYDFTPKSYIVDPKTNERIPLPDNPDPTTPITADGKTLNDLLYPDRPQDNNTAATGVQTTGMSGTLMLAAAGLGLLLLFRR